MHIRHTVHMANAPAFGSRKRAEWDQDRLDSERAGLRHRVHREHRAAVLERERESLTDTERAYVRGELDRADRHLVIASEFGDWAESLGGLLRGRKPLSEYADRSLPERLRSVADHVLSGAESGEISREAYRRDGATDLFASAFLARELIDSGSPADTLRELAREIAESWGRVLDGRVAELEPGPIDVIPSEPTGMGIVDWDGLIVRLEAAADDGSAESETDGELASWELSLIHI